MQPTNLNTMQRLSFSSTKYGDKIVSFLLSLRTYQHMFIRATAKKKHCLLSLPPHSTRCLFSSFVFSWEGERNSSEKVKRRSFARARSKFTRLRRYHARNYSFFYWREQFLPHTHTHTHTRQGKAFHEKKEWIGGQNSKINAPKSKQNMCSGSTTHCGRLPVRLGIKVSRFINFKPSWLAQTEKSVWSLLIILPLIAAKNPWLPDEIMPLPIVEGKFICPNLVCKEKTRKPPPK